MATHISIDVDQTLLDDEGQLIPGVRENLASLKKRGLVLQLWSKGGSEYALETAEKWKLKEFFTSYAAKPDIAIDDLPEDTHPVCSLGVPFASATKVLNEVVADSIETTLCPSKAVVEMIGRLQKKKRIVKRDFGPVLRLDTPLHPIPFFGNLESAQVLTIGLNPSSTEFAPWRQWPTTEWIQTSSPGDLRPIFGRSLPARTRGLGITKKPLASLAPISRSTRRMLICRPGQPFLQRG